jgi:ATP-dependent RNA helicase RhlE
MSFESLGLSAELLRALGEQGYTIPTPIQLQAIPVILEGRDILAAAQTGTGKTAGFTLPMLQRLTGDEEAKRQPKQPRALVLVPTRELAAQVAESVTTYGRHLNLKSAVIFGGVKINPQIAALRSGVDILVATPGRLLDHVQQRTLDLSRVEILVLDEADRMLDMGFIHDIRKVLALLPPKRQNLLFSATFSGEIRTLADKLLDRPVSVDVAPRNTAAELVEQVVHPVDKGRKRELLSHLIGANNWRQVLVFTRTKHGANRLAKQLDSDGLTAAAIHGNKTQGARTRALAGFKDGSVRVLVATDIAARGLDIDQLPHVVNFELPNVAEDYVHRIGRTGRAGNEGEAMSLVCVDELRLLRDIERLLGRKIRSEVMPGYEVDPSIPAEPIQNGRGARQGGAGAGRGRQGSPARTGQAQAGRGQRAAKSGTDSKGRSGSSRSSAAGGSASASNRGRAERGNTRSSNAVPDAADRGNQARNANQRAARDDDFGNRKSSGRATQTEEANGNTLAHAAQRHDGGPRRGSKPNTTPDPRGGNRAGNGNGKPRAQANGNGARRAKPALLGG